jgi:hypothetical protein
MSTSIFVAGRPAQSTLNSRRFQVLARALKSTAPPSEPSMEHESKHSGSVTARSVAACSAISRLRFPPQQSLCTALDLLDLLLGLKVLVGTIRKSTTDEDNGVETKAEPGALLALGSDGARQRSLGGRVASLFGNKKLISM